MIETVDALERVVPARCLHEILIVIAPASSEESFAVCRSLEATRQKVRLLVQQHTPGLGWAIREGFEAAAGTHVLMMGSDRETDPKAVPVMLDKLVASGADIVTANRWVKGAGFSGYNGLKLVLNYIFQQLMRLMFRTPLCDLTFGFRVMPTAMVKAIRWEHTRHEFLLESILKPLRLGARIEQVPVRWEARTEGESKNEVLGHARYFKVAAQLMCAGRDRILLPGASY